MKKKIIFVVFILFCISLSVFGENKLFRKPITVNITITQSRSKNQSVSDVGSVLPEEEEEFAELLDSEEQTEPLEQEDLTELLEESAEPEEVLDLMELPEEQTELEEMSIQEELSEIEEQTEPKELLVLAEQEEYLEPVEPKEMPEPEEYSELTELEEPIEQTKMEESAEPVVTVKQTKMVENGKKEAPQNNKNSISVNAGYFMPLSETWANALLPVVRANITFTTFKTQFSNSGVGFSLSLRAGYAHLRERGANSYRDHRFYFSMPLNFDTFVHSAQNFTLSAGPYYCLMYINEKGLYQENWNNYTISSFGLEVFTKFTNKINSSLSLNLETNLLIPLINRDFMSLGISAGIECKL